MANHTVEAGDTFETETGDTVTVQEVKDNGAVVWSDGDEDTEEAVCNALTQGVLTRDDGKSHELVKSF